MEILIVMPVAKQRGGAEKLLSELMQHGRGEEVEWTVVFLEPGPMIAEFEALGVRTDLIPAGRLREIGPYLQVVRQLARLIKQAAPDLVFSWMGKGHLYGGPAARLAGIPAFWYQHGISEGLALMDRLQTLIPAQGILACSRAAREAQEAFWPSRPTRTVYPCVDIEHYDPEGLPPPGAMRKKFGLPTMGPLVGTVGRLQRWKGMHVLVDALPAVRAVHEDVHCIIVGGEHALEPDYPDELRARIAAQGLERHVTLAGYQRNVAEWMQALDVFVHTSDHEPFGMVVVEAMALGKPVVAGAAGGPDEIITDGVDGLLAPYEDPVTLSHQIIRYLDQPDFAQEVGARARRRAKHFAAQLYPRHFLDALASIKLQLAS